MKRLLCISAIACLLSGCISIENHVFLEGSGATPDASAEMQASGTTNRIGTRAAGSCAITCAIYSHKTISPDTTATLTK